jgi:hypothetical protein
MQGVSLSTASITDVQDVFPSTVSSMSVQGVSLFYLQQYGRAGCTPFLMLECQTVRPLISLVLE